VQFSETIGRLYSDGYRLFIEVGPAGMLTSFVTDILQDKQDVTAVASDSREHSGVRQLHHMLAQVFVAGVAFEPAALYAHRDIPALDLCAAPRPAPKAGIKLKLQMPELRVPRGWKPMHRQS